MVLPQNTKKAKSQLYAEPASASRKEAELRRLALEQPVLALMSL